MITDLHLGFTGNCNAAFAFYETVFRTKREFTMTWGEAPAEVNCPPGAENLVIHTSMRVGTINLMGADAPPGRGKPFSGFDISISDPDENEVRRMFDALSEGGHVFMPPSATFWSPLFGMCTDRFGVSWMISVPGPQA